jgi:hypothetical protein
MMLEKIPAWILSIALAAISIGFLVSIFILDETKYFADLKFGPPNVTENNIMNELKPKSFGHPTTKDEVTLIGEFDFCALKQVRQFKLEGFCLIQQKDRIWTGLSTNSTCAAVCLNFTRTNKVSFDVGLNPRT